MDRRWIGDEHESEGNDKGDWLLLLCVNIFAN